MVTLYQPKVVKALKAQIAPVVAEIRNKGAKWARGHIGQHDFNFRIGPVIMNLYKDAGVATANRTFSLLNRVLGVNKAGQLAMIMKYRTFGHNDKWTAEMQQYFKRHLLDKVVTPISQTTRDFILRILNKGIDEGWGVDRMVKELETSDITTNRARLIVRTESTRAVNYGGMAAAFANDYEMQKTWNEVKDNRTRKTHRHGSGVGGQKVDLLHRFSNGLLFPGDPDGSAAEVCNCRCVLTYSPKRDKNGRLIPKKVQPASGIEVVPQQEEVIQRPTLAESIIHGAVIEIINNFLNDN